MPPELEDFEVRTIQPEDNKALASVIRNTLAEFNAHKPGTVYFDTTTDKLSEVFQTPNSVYFVVLKGEKIVGGGGIYPTGALPKDTCELVKMYLLPSASSCADDALLRVLKTYDKKNGNSMFVENVPEGHLFETGDGKIFKKGEKIRKRFQCIEVATKKLYLFSPVYEVTLFSPRKEA